MAKLGLDGLNTLLSGFEDKGATAICTFAYCQDANSEPIVFEGKTEGRIVAPRGDNRFGWDPVFEVAGTEETYSEMDPKAKNKVSREIPNPG